MRPGTSAVNVKAAHQAKRFDWADGLQFQLRALDLDPGQREFRFAPPRQWRFDLCWPDRLLACEIHGGEFSVGRHVRGIGMAQDFEKLNQAQLLGYVVLCFTGNQVKTGEALTALEQALKG